ncbi:MAG: hypothetical protein QOG39_355, partial [Acidimicrobiaceae bacterium]
MLRIMRSPERAASTREMHVY